MCMMCADSIDICYEEPCAYTNAEGHKRGRIYSVGERYCPHLAEKWGHDEVLWRDRHPHDAGDYFEDFPGWQEHVRSCDDNDGDCHDEDWSGEWEPAGEAE